MSRVLLVEDGEELRELMCEFLRGEGFEVDLARDGETALDLVRVRSDDAVVMDDDIPNLTGRQMLDGRS